MGSGIAQVFAQYGFSIILYDLDSGMLQQAENNIIANLRLLTEKNKLSQNEMDAALSRITYTGDVTDCKADLIIEAVVEDLSEKKALFFDLEDINGPDTIYTTNTSSLSVTSIAEQLQARERFAGMHFFNPAPAMKLVEIISTRYTAGTTLDFLMSVVNKAGKTAIRCKDAPGFIVNRVARPYYLEALRLAETGLVEHETTDLLMEASGFKMGPFRLMDLIGNDINYSVSKVIYEALGSPARLRPSAIQQQKITAGALGRKTGKGYYEYPG